MTEGNVVRYGYIEKFIEQLGEKFNIRESAFDRWGAVQMVQNLEGMGFTVVPFGQGFKDMSPPTNSEIVRMANNISIGNLADTIMDGLKEYAAIATEDMKNAVKDAGKTVRKEIQSNAPSNTGAYAKSWSIKTIKETAKLKSGVNIDVDA